MINDAEIRIRAERRMGEMLRDQEMNKGAATPSRGAIASIPTLAEMGITLSMSSRAQKIVCFIGVLVGGVSFPDSRRSNH